VGKYELRPGVKKLYQLRPKVCASGVSVASRFVNPKHDELHPAFSKKIVSGASKDMRKQNVQKLEGSYTVLFTLLYFIHNYMHTYRIVQ
jgi:hypothetical protein